MLKTRNDISFIHIYVWMTPGACCPEHHRCTVNNKYFSLVLDALLLFCRQNFSQEFLLLHLFAIALSCDSCTRVRFPGERGEPKFRSCHFLTVRVCVWNARFTVASTIRTY